MTSFRKMLVVCALACIFTLPAAARSLTGTASVYRASLHGRRTASGARYDRHRMTLASRHLPMGSRVRVTNLRTGRSAMGQVTDRCGSRRVADLSEALARGIGMSRRQGLARVRIEVIR